jgi:4-diphosphocytidyl-2-C-methyl-D-erythritol kinase
VIRAIAPAKINLVFQVGQSHAGYHEVNSLYLGLDLFEEITLTEAAEGTGLEILVSVENLPERHLKAVPTDKTNLVYQVIVRMFEKFEIALPDLLVSIHKRIPVAGGMAGGSADAAATMVAVNELLAKHYGIQKLSKTELLDLAKEFGSDVPFSLLGGLAIGKGRGEKLTQLPALAFDCYFVLLVSPAGLSTANVFARFDQLGITSNFKELNASIDSVTELADFMENDLQQAAISLQPGIGDSIARLESLGALKAMVSGSGPTVLGLFQTKDQATAAIEQLSSEGLLTLLAKPSYLETRLL